MYVHWNGRKKRREGKVDEEKGEKEKGSERKR